MEELVRKKTAAFRALCERCELNVLDDFQLPQVAFHKLCREVQAILALMVTRASLYLKHLQVLGTATDKLAAQIFETTKRLIRGEEHADPGEARIELDSVSKNMLEEGFEKEFVAHVRRYTTIVHLKSEREKANIEEGGVLETVMHYFYGTPDSGIARVAKLASVLNACIATALECLKVHRLVEVWRCWLFKVVSEKSAMDSS